MRRRAKVDGNHKAIVAGLRAAGCSVLDLSACGGGVPDLLVGFNGRERLVEVKSPGATKPHGKRRAETLDRQAEFAAAWRGVPVARVETLFEALAAMREVTA